MLSSLLRPRRLGWPRTPDFQSGNTGSNPVGDTNASGTGDESAVGAVPVEPIAALPVLLGWVESHAAGHEPAENLTGLRYSLRRLEYLTKLCSASGQTILESTGVEGCDAMKVR